MPDMWSDQPSAGTQTITIDRMGADELRDYVDTVAQRAPEFAKAFYNIWPSARECWLELMELLFYAIRVLGIGDSYSPFPQSVVGRCTLFLPEDRRPQDLCRVVKHDLDYSVPSIKLTTEIAPVFGAGWYCLVV